MKQNKVNTKKANIISYAPMANTTNPFQGNWHGKNLLSNTCYGIFKHEWMITKIFALWFTNFVKQVKECPLLVV